MGRRKNLINNTTIPQHQIEAIARCILPDILAFYESEEGQREFAEWQEQHQKETNLQDKPDSKTA
ncbi:hypothetical protein [Angelakisella massiliensis]|uniref:hypothetical protein n=1 Tax=Angelakisella massiliensis TaxID=1871018 RepID=UPI0008F7F43B|nr:hypothetical protein [Angelakisella massiliensis]